MQARCCWQVRMSRFGLEGGMFLHQQRLWLWLPPHAAPSLHAVSHPSRTWSRLSEAAERRGSFTHSRTFCSDMKPASDRSFHPRNRLGDLFLSAAAQRRTPLEGEASVIQRLTSKRPSLPLQVACLRCCAAFQAWLAMPSRRFQKAVSNSSEGGITIS